MPRSLARSLPPAPRKPLAMGFAGLSRTSVYERVAAGTFPQPCRLGTNTRWSEREVQDWIAERLAERPGQEATR